MTFRKPLLNQLCGSVGTICLFFTNGYLIAIQSIMVPHLRTSSLHLTTEQESWIPSITILMLLPTTCICGLLTDVYGRKWILSIGLIPQILTCIILYFAQDFYILLFAYGVAGLFGAGFAAGPNMLAEISSPKYRGSILNAKVASLSIGLAVAHCLGNFFDWRSLALFGGLPNLIGLLAAVTTPESPAWLASKGRFDDCKAAFHWYRGDDDQTELAKLIAQQENVLEEKIELSRTKGNIQRALKFLCHPGFLKAVALNLSSYIFIEMCGKQIFMAYAFDTIGALVSDKGNVFYYALGLDLADVLALCMSCEVIKKFKRRSLVFGTGAPALVLLLVISLVSFLLSKGYIPEKLSFISLVLLSIYFMMLNVAVIPNLFSVRGEIYPLSHRGFGVTVSGFLFVLAAFVVTKITPSLMRVYGISGTFLMNAALSAIALGHLYFYLPETVNKTLQDIEEEMVNEPQTETRLNRLDIKDKRQQYPYSVVPALEPSLLY